MSVDAMAEAMHQVTELLKVAFDAAEGVKRDLAERGYSESAQEQIAVAYLEGVLRVSLRGAT